MKILYLKSCKWLLSQNQQVRIDFLRYRRYEALAKHIKPLKKKKTVKRKDVSAPTISIILDPLMILLQKLDSIKFFISIFVDIGFLLQESKEDDYHIFITTTFPDNEHCKCNTV